MSDAAGWIMAGCGVIAVIVITALMSSLENGIAAAVLFLGFLTGGFLATTVHEFGHALAAHLVGWRVWIISVLGVVHRSEHGVRLSTHYSHDVGGYMLASPPSATHDSKWRSIIVSAGGPLASVISGPIVVALIFFMPPAPWRETPIGEAIVVSALAFGFASCVAALATLWPSRGDGGRPNDMQMILDAAFQRDPSADVRGVAWAWALFEYGIEPAAWPRWMHDAIARSAANPWASPAAPLLAFFCALQNGDEAAARDAARRSTHATGRLMRAYVSAHFDNDAVTAQTELGDLVIDGRETALTLLRRVIDIRLAELNGHPNAPLLRAKLAEDLRVDVPKPYWSELLGRMGLSSR